MLDASDEGLLIPLGKSTPTVSPSTSRRANARKSHNEFVVYREDQVRVRYLLLVARAK